MQAITLIIGEKQIDVLNVYNTDKRITGLEYTHYFEQLQNAKLAIARIGDFNGHNKVWGGRGVQNDKAGLSLEEVVLLYDDTIMLYTPVEMKTRTDPETGRQSTLDLVFGSHIFKDRIHVSVMDDDWTSDHYPIKVLINMKVCSNTIKVRKKWHIDKDKIGKWQKVISDMKYEEKVLNSDVDTLNDAISKDICSSAKKVFRQSSGKYNPKYRKPWWNIECNRLAAYKKRMKKVFIRTPTLENKVNYRKAENAFKKHVKKSKIESWEKYTENLKADTPVKVVWNQVNKLRGTFSAENVPFEVEGKLIVDRRKKAEILKDTYDKCFNNHFYNFREKCTLLVQVTNGCNTDSTDNYNSEISRAEVVWAQNKLKNVTPGLDDVHPVLLKNLPEDYVDNIHQLFKASWRQSKVPCQWKKALVYPILKKNKPAAEPCSYRPIAVLSCLGKWMEAIINNRLAWYLEKSNKLSATQLGFRKQHSTRSAV